jgi:hypothetical protein
LVLILLDILPAGKVPLYLDVSSRTARIFSRILDELPIFFME